jgi:hypothetical protein
MGITVAVTRVACNTATGDQTITTSKLGGLTPKAAIFICSGGVTDGVAAAHMRMSFGVSDGSNHIVGAVRGEDAVGTSNESRWGATDEVVQMLNTTADTIDGEANFKNWTENGVVVTWGAALTSAHLLTVVFFAGGDLSAAVGEMSILQPSGTETSETGLSFEPDQLVIFGTGAGFGDSHGTASEIYAGFVDNGASIVHAESAFIGNNNVAVSQVGMRSSHTRIGSNITHDSLSRAAEITAFASDGFTATHRGPANFNIGIGWLALNYGGVARHWVDILASPTSIGDWSQTGPEFPPQFVFALPNLTSALDSNNSGEMSCGYMVIDKEEEYCVSISNEDAVGTMNAQSLSDDIAVNLPDDTGAALFTGTGPSGSGSFNDDGFTINFSAVSGIARQWPFLAIEEAPFPHIPGKKRILEWHKTPLLRM